LRHFIAQAGMSGKFYAAYVPATGRIAYVASNIPSVTAAQRGFIEGLFQHEGRHKGFDLVFGSPAMKRAWFLQAAKSMGKDVQNWLSYYNLPDTPEGRAKAAEEIIVDWAKTGKVHRLVDRLLAKIAAWIRRTFPKLKMSYAEIRQMLARVDDWMESGEEAPRLIGPLEAEPAFGRGAGSEKKPATQQEINTFIDRVVKENDPRGELVLRKASDKEAADVKSQGWPDISGMSTFSRLTISNML